MSDIEQYLAPEICAECGGKCCQGMSGATKPEDFARFDNDLKDALVTAFKTGNWVIDWWEDDPRGLPSSDPQAVSCGYYIRPRVVTDRRGLYCPSWGGACCFWTEEEGCVLPPFERPWSCRILEPKLGNAPACCVQHGGGKNEAAVAWIGLHSVIKAAASEIANDGN